MESQLRETAAKLEELQELRDAKSVEMEVDVLLDSSSGRDCLGFILLSDETERGSSEARRGD